ncbi:MAG: hypothetical protein J5824_01860 [Lachnospiraceae bacterium]|nr:hypothetical protein [Lachnospiraceae bacterium]
MTMQLSNAAKDQVTSEYLDLAGNYPVLGEREYSDIDAAVKDKEYSGVIDLYASIISHAVSKQLKTGLYREYIRKKDDLTVMHGTMDIRGTVRNRLERKYLISCESDELSENNPFNRMLKTTMMFLLRRNEVRPETRTELKKQILAFSQIETSDAGMIDWKRLMDRRSSGSMIMLAQVCRRTLEWQRE